MINISKAAKAAGLPVKTVRYYGDIGLVAAQQRSASGYRLYDDRSLRKLIFVRRTRGFGFSIEACRDLMIYITTAVVAVLTLNASPRGG